MNEFIFLKRTSIYTFFGPHLTAAAGLPRRLSLESTTSSWIKLAVCIISPIVAIHRWFLCRILFEKSMNLILNCNWLVVFFSNYLFSCWLKPLAIVQITIERMSFPLPSKWYLARSFNSWSEQAKFYKQKNYTQWLDKDYYYYYY